MLLFLAVIPALAYPLQLVLPGFKHKGRKGQRDLAIILSCIGYTAGVVVGYLTKADARVQLVYNTYLISVLVLLFLNCFHIRASGHACSVVGPLLFLCCYGRYEGISPCIIVAMAVVWSSLVLKRHTVRELVLGGAASTVTFVIMNALL